MHTPTYRGGTGQVGCAHTGRRMRLGHPGRRGQRRWVQLRNSTPLAPASQDNPGSVGIPNSSHNAGIRARAWPSQNLLRNGLSRTIQTVSYVQKAHKGAKLDRSGPPPPCFSGHLGFLDTGGASTRALGAKETAEEKGQGGGRIPQSFRNPCDGRLDDLILQVGRRARTGHGGVNLARRIHELADQVVRHFGFAFLELAYDLL